MGKNSIQLQAGLSLSQFFTTYGTEEQCEAVLIKSRWPNGYRCPKCNGAHPYVYWKNKVKTYQCNLPKAGFTNRGDNLSLYETPVG